MPAPVSKTVRLNLGLLARLEKLRERSERRAGVPVDLRKVVERVVVEGLAAVERQEEGPEATAAT